MRLSVWQISLLYLPLAAAPAFDGAQVSESSKLQAESCQALLIDLLGDLAQVADIQKLPVYKKFVQHRLRTDPEFAGADEISRVAEYIRSRGSRFQGESLESLRDRSLQKMLSKLGLSDVRNVRERMRELSSKNLQRSRSKISFTDSVLPEIESLVDELRLNPVHNSKFNQKILSSPLLSSHQRKILTGKEGQNSIYWFNSTFTAQEDQIFFFANFSHPSVERKSIYGSTTLSLNREALQDGWVSPFVMNPVDLADAGTRIAPKIAQQAMEPLGNRASYGDRIRFGSIKHQKAFLALRKAQLNVVFTPQDFEVLVRDQLKSALQRLSREDSASYAEFVSVLRTGKFLTEAGERTWHEYLRKLAGLPTMPYPSPYPTDYVLDLLVFEPLQLPRYWELKVPVAIPPSQVTVKIDDLK